MERYRPEELDIQSLEKQPHETAGKWAERLLVHVINATGAGEAKHASEDEDRYGVDTWIKVAGIKEAIPVNLTLETVSEVSWERIHNDAIPNDRLNVVEKKYRNALETGFAVFEATPAGVSLRDMKLAALGGVEFQKKVLGALNEAIADWAARLKEEGKSFITREELANLIAADKAESEAQKRPPRKRRSHSYYKREKRTRPRTKARSQ